MIALLALILFSLVLCLVTLRIPALGLGLAAAADLVLMEGVAVGSTTIAAESFFFLFLIGLPFFRGVVNRNASSLPMNAALPYLSFLGAFALVCLASSVLGGSLGEAGRVLVRLPLYGLFGLAPVWLCRSERDIKRVATVVVCACVLLLLAAGLRGLPDVEEQGGLMRHGYLNPLAHGLSLGALLAFGLSTRGAPRGHRRTLLRLVACLLLAGVLWTGSRGALVSGVVGIFVIYWVVSPGPARSAAKLAALAGSALFLFALGTGHVSAAWDGFVTQDATSNLYRYQIIVLAGRLFVSNPILGVGLGGMEQAGIFQAADLGSLATTIISSDNDYARVVAELGGLGVLVVIFWGRFLRQRYREAITEVRLAGWAQRPTLALGAGLGAHLLVLGLFESVLFSPTGWFYVGLCWACVRIRGATA